MVIGAPGHQRSNFDDGIYIRCAAPPYSARIRTIHLLLFGKVSLGSVCWPPCATPGNEFMKGSRKLLSYFKYLTRLWTKVQEILGQCRRPFVLSNILPRLSISCSFRRYSPLSQEVFEKLNKCKVFGRQIFFGRYDPNFSAADCLRDLLATVWHSLVEFCLLITVSW